MGFLCISNSADRSINSSVKPLHYIQKEENVKMQKKALTNVRARKLEPLVPRFTGSRSGPRCKILPSGRVKVSSVKGLNQKETPRVRNIRTPSPPPPKATPGSVVSSDGSSSDGEKLSDTSSKESIHVSSDAVTSTPLLRLQPDGERDSPQNSTVSSRTRSVTSKRRRDNLDSKVSLSVNGDITSSANEDRAALGGTSGTTPLEAPRPIRRSLRFSRDSAASRSSQQSIPRRPPASPGLSMEAINSPVRESIGCINHRRTILGSLSPNTLSADESQSSRDSGCCNIPSFNSMPLLQSQHRSVALKKNVFSGLSSRSSVEGMSLPTPPPREVAAAKTPTLTQDTISSGSSAGSSKTQGDSSLSGNSYFIDSSNQRFSASTEALRSQNIASTATLRTEQGEDLNLSETSATTDLGRVWSQQRSPLQQHIQSPHIPHMANLNTTANATISDNTLIESTTVDQNLPEGNDVSNLQAGEVVEESVSTSNAPAMQPPATVRNTPSGYSPGLGSNSLVNNFEILTSAHLYVEAIGRKRKGTTGDLGPSASSSVKVDGGAYVDLNDNLNGLNCLVDSVYDEEASEAPGNIMRDRSVSKWEAARRDRAAMNGGLFSQAQQTTLEVLLSWPCRAPLELTKLALPHVVVDRYRHQRGITGAHTWQVEALRSGEGRCWQHGDHLVYSAPTGGGKTLVAELLMLRRLLQSDSCGTILWAVPLKALANEVAQKLSQLLQDLAVVKAFHGDDGGAKLSPKVKVAVCTYERANAIVNMELAQQQAESSGTTSCCRGGLGGISMLVVDEVHNLESNPILERLLAKVAFANQVTALGSTSDGTHQDSASFGSYHDNSGLNNPSATVQIVACSATIPNADALAAFLNGWCYTTAIRTTALHWLAVGANKSCTSSNNIKSSCIEGNSSSSSSSSSSSNSSSTLRSSGCPVYALKAPCSSAFEVDATPERVLPVAGSDPTGLIAATRETLDEGGSVLVFCNARYLTTKFAAQLCKALHQHCAATPSNAHISDAISKATTSATMTVGASAEVEKQKQLSEAREALAAGVVQACGSRAARGLCAALRCGVGFHHAGLSQEEKALVEQGFRARTLNVLCATTTLANGVNTPATRVIIADLFYYNATKKCSVPFSVQELKQMGGRAGRQGENLTNNYNGHTATATAAGSVVLLLATSTKGSEAELVPWKEGALGHRTIGSGSNTGSCNGSGYLMNGGLKAKSWFVHQILGHDQPSIKSSLLAPSLVSPNATTSSNSCNNDDSHGVDRGQLPTSSLEVDSVLLETAVLEAIVLGLANTRPALLTYVHCFFAAMSLHAHAQIIAKTRAHAEREDDDDIDNGRAQPLLEAALDSALNSLLGCTSLHSNTTAVDGNVYMNRIGNRKDALPPLITATFEALVPEALGRAATASMLSPRDARTLQRDFSAAACGGLVLESTLHLLCLVAPLDAHHKEFAVNFPLLAAHLVESSGHDDWGRVADAFLCPRWRGMVQRGGSGQSLGEEYQQFQRFWLALLLKHVIEEETAIGSVSCSSGISSSDWRGGGEQRRSFFAAVNLEAGSVQTLQRLAFEQCSKAVAFCKALGYDALASLLKPLKARLQYGVKKELLPLKVLARDARATPALLRSLFDAGFTHPKKLLQPGAAPRLLHTLASRRQTHYVEHDAGAKHRAEAAHQADTALVAQLIKAARGAEAERKRRTDQF